MSIANDDPVSNSIDRNEALIEELEKLIYAICHERRAALTMIGGYANLLMSSNFGQLNDEQHKAVKSMESGAKKQRLVIDVPEPQYAKSDRDYCSKMVSYVLDNACKYSGKEGKIKVASRVQLDGILISVSDNGIGISEEEQQHIFKGWYRGNHEIVRQTEGLGRGLYSAKRLAEALGCEMG